MAQVVESISDAFREYLKEKTPKSWEREEVSKYRTRIYEVLNSEYGLLSFFQSGSFSNGTGVTGRSDVDYIARLPFDRRNQSSNSNLEAIKTVLKRELWEASNIWVSRPTVSIDFRGVITQYEITPAFYERGDAGDNAVLLIPGPNGTWRESAPKAHLKYVRESDTRHWGNVKGLARLLKSWKYENDVSVSSFYLEMRSAEYGNKRDSLVYVADLPRILKEMIDHEVRAMNDPTGLVNRIYACSSESARSSTLRAMKSALPHLQTARQAWLDDDDYTASTELRSVFGSQFPYVL
ncbi:nucleotidyltransferase [Streptomyces sp. NPDC006356]